MTAGEKKLTLYLLTVLFFLGIMLFWLVREINAPDKPEKEILSFRTYYTGETKGISRFCLFEDSLRLVALNPLLRDSTTAGNYPVLLISAEAGKTLQIPDSAFTAIFDKNFNNSYFFKIRTSPHLQGYSCEMYAQAHSDKFLKKQNNELYCLIFKDLKTENIHFWQSEKKALQYIFEKKIRNKLQTFIRQDF
jgi:hypothetical protein